MRFVWTLVLAALPFSAGAQVSDKDFLTSYLEETLSSAGRVVTITGFSGALSSRATMAKMTIADDLGIWLTVEDVTLDWSQSSLLSGQVIINEFSAAEIELARIPSSGETGMRVEAGSFALPDLPVSIDIGTIAARHIVLGQAVLGQAVEGELTASMQLSGGAGQVQIDLLRTDTGPKGKFGLTAAFAQETGLLDLTLTAAEGAGGVAVTLLGVPGAPSAEVSVQGSGPINAFTADVSLKTDNVTRLAGQVALFGDDQGQGFTADLAGDPTPVFLPQYATFFGPDVAIHAKGQRFPGGRMTLSDFQMRARALTLDGTLDLDSGGVPSAFALTGKVGLPDGAVLLPLTTEGETWLDSGTLSLDFDRAKGPQWNGSTVLNGLSHPMFRAGRAVLAGKGIIAKTGSFSGELAYQIADLSLTDPAVAQALGNRIDGNVTLDWVSGGSLNVPTLALHGDGYDISGDFSTDGLATGFATKGYLDGQATDLARFSALTGLDLRGEADFSTAFETTLMSGAIKASVSARGRGLGLGITTLDRLLVGESTVEFSGARDQTGITIADLSVTTTGFAASGKGRITSDGSDLTGDVKVDDLHVLGAGYGGAISGKASLTGASGSEILAVQATGRNLALGQTQADILLRGNSQLSGQFNLTDDGLVLKQLDISNPQITARITGQEGRLQIDQRIVDLGLLYPQFPGALITKGTAVQGPSGYVIDLAAKGPAQIDARIKGQVALGFGRADLAISGTASAGLANKLAAPRSLSGPVRFDLRMVGPFGLTSLSGPVTISGGQAADPSQTFGIKSIEGTAQLSSGQARVSGTGAVSTGGSVGVEGTVGIIAPYTANLAISVQDIVLRDPSLYTTRVNGAVTLNGPALGAAVVAGAVTLGRTELLIPSSGFAGDGDLPGLQHINEPEASRATRARAAQSGGGGADSGSAGYSLNLRISAPNQVFIRGRGLDAELGGALTLRGTTGAIVPSGAFNLIRGRLDILGQRLNLTEALLQVQGALVPFVRIVASVESDGITASVLIQGPADDPEVTFTSTPQLPQEEVLARLLFDRGLETLSAFQAIQLAGAVATLAGKGGAGVIGNIRKGAGLDNLDITANGDGNAAVTVGKYLSENAYSEVTVDQGGKSSVSINLDLAPHITLKGRVDSEGQTGIGVFLQRDY